MELYPVAPGTYRLLVRHPAHLYVAEASLAGQDLLTGAATLRAGAGDPVLRITLREGVGSVAGRLPVEKATDEAGCFLRLFPVRDCTGASPHVQQVYCNPDGSFEIPSVAPNRYKLMVFTREEALEADVDSLGEQRWDTAVTLTVSREERTTVSVGWP